MITSERRVEMERNIALLTVAAMLNVGYRVGVDTGGEDFDCVIESLCGAEEKLCSSDHDRLVAIRRTDGSQVGSALLVYGNDGYDALADYSMSLEPLLAGVIELSNIFEREATR